MKKFNNTLFAILLFNIAFSQNFMHVDQFGYEKNATKVAVISNPQIGYNANDSYTPSSNLEIIDNVTNQVIMTISPQIWDNGNTHNLSGDKGWWLDFSSLTTVGEYYIYDNTNNIQSAVFRINENPYQAVLKTACRMFYYNRCGTDKPANFAGAKWSDATNFTQDINARYINDQSNPNLERDVSGGWFDAGDYNKYVTFTNTTLHNLLTAYEQNPTAFSDNWNIPESGNGIPDIIDEIMWELQWLEKMQNIDGSVHIKAGSRNYNENSASPPSINSDTRYYGPTCTSASACVASVFAHASIVLKQFPTLQSYATNLEQKAINSFNYTLPFYNNNTLELDCDDGSIVSGDADIDFEKQVNWMIEAAIYLYEVTNNNTYQNFIINEHQYHSMFSINYIDHYALQSVDAFLRYNSSSNANNTVKNTFETLLTNNVSNNFEDIYGFNSLDLYRAFVPNYSYHWGSNQAIAELGNLNIVLSRYNILADSLNYLNKAKEQIHYFHGVNPQSMVYLSNMYDFGATRSANEIYHGWFYDGTSYDNALTSTNGPAPGFLVGGANTYYSYPNLTPPYNQPEQKSYLDFNDDWPESSWEITEPAIYYQAAYIRLLSYFVNDLNISSTNLTTQNKIFVNIYPNPTSDILTVDFKQPISDYTIRIFNSNGQCVAKSNNERELDISNLSSGRYNLKIETEEKIIFMETFIKI